MQRGRDAKPQLAGLGPGEHLQAEAPGGDQLGPALVPFQQTLERRRDLAVAGPQAEQLIEVADRARVITDEILGDSGRFLQHVGAPIQAAAHRQPGVVGVEHLAPALRHREGDDQRAEGPVGIGRRLQHRAKHLDRLGRVLAEAVGGETYGAVGQHPQHRLGHLGTEVRAIEVQQLARPVLVGDDGRLQAFPGRLVRGLCRRCGERFLEQAVRQWRHRRRFGLLDSGELRCHGPGSLVRQGLAIGSCKQSVEQPMTDSCRAPNRHRRGGCLRCSGARLRHATFSRILTVTGHRPDLPVRRPRRRPVRDPGLRRHRR